MKHFFLLLFLWQAHAFSQTTMFTGAINNDWHNGNNWNTGMVPTGINNVLIEAGKNAVASSPVVCNSIALNSGSSLNIAANLNCNTHIMVPPGAILIWTSGQISAATLTNQGQMNLVPFGSKQLINQSVLNNEGTMVITTDWTLDIANGTVNNLPTGTIDLHESQAGIIGSGSGLHILNNSGIIKKTTSSGPAVITAELRNNGGTLLVEAGSLQLDNALTKLTNSTINVQAGNTMVWTNTVTLEGSSFTVFK